MKKLQLSFLILLLCYSLFGVKLRLHYTNDTHGASLPREYTSETGKICLGGYASLEYALERSRKEAPRSIWLDAGDQQTGTAFAARKYKGAIGGAVVEVFNRLALDATTFGNHEFDQTVANLDRLKKLAKYPYLSANLIRKSDFTTYGDRPYTIIKTDSLSIGVIGLTLTELPEKVKAENVAFLNILPYKAAVNRYLDELDTKTDLIVLLTHLGLPADSLLATQLDDRVDLIVGGHSHDWLETPLRVNGIYICTAASYLALLGRLDLEVVDDRIVSLDNLLIRLTPPPAEYSSPLTRFVNDIETRINKELDQVIGTIPEDWIPDKFKETPLSIWMAQALMREYAKKLHPDLAILNLGGFRKNLPKGDITLRDMQELIPFNNYVVTFTAIGEDIIKFFELNEGNRMTKPYDICQTSAKGWITHYCKEGWEDHIREPELDLGDEIMDPQKTYTIISHDYIAGQWQKYLGFEPKNLKETNDLVLDAMIRQVRKQFGK